MRSFLINGISEDGSSLVLSNSLEPEDAEAFCNILNDFDIHRNMMSSYFPFPYTLDDAMVFLERNREILGEVFAVDFKIMIEDEIVGLIGLADIDSKNRSAHVGYVTGKKYRNRGIASAALSMVCTFAAQSLGLKKFHTSVMHDNLASIRVLIKCGFKMDGIQSDGFHFNGSSADLFLFSCTLPC